MLTAILLGTLLRSVALPDAVWAETGLLSARIAFGNMLVPGQLEQKKGLSL